MDECPIICIGLSTLLEKQADLSTYWHGQSFREALHHIRIGKPDLVIVGLKIEGSNIFDLIKKIRNIDPEVKILVCGSCHGGSYTRRLLGCGARGYIQKSATIQAFLTAIRSLLNGKIYISSENMEEHESETCGKQCGALNTPLSALASRELEVFRLIGSGKTSPQIAKEMGLSEKTVETYKSNIIEKLSLRNNVELIQMAFASFEETENE